jgi:hypothetical protein
VDFHLSMVVALIIYTTDVLRCNLSERLIHFKNLVASISFPDVAIQQLGSVKRGSGKRFYVTLAGSGRSSVPCPQYSHLIIRFNPFRGKAMRRNES